VRVGVGKRLVRLVVAAVIAVTTWFVYPATAEANDNYAAIVVDANTGEVLFSRNADLSRYPASLTKMMTLYLIFEDLERGKISLNSRLSVSRNAANQAPSKLGLSVGSTIRVEDAILALVTKSANDVAMVVAENLSASADAFAYRMTQTARSLGMNSTVFRNPHGLPNSGQVTTARDMSILGRALYDRFPQYYGYFSVERFTWNGTTYGNHNNLLGVVDGVNGIKTGYIRASGFNLVTSVQRGNRYVVAVVMGGITAASRDAHMAELLDTYLPRATTGPRTAPLVVASPADLVPVPLPRPNPARTDPIMTAAIPTSEPAPAPAPAIVPPAPVGEVAAVVEPPAQGDFDPGWSIQIGAFPNEAAALQRLDAARALEAALLANASPYTQPVDVNGTTLIRARFAGFATNEAAQQACSRFVSHGMDCFVP